jgi:hypothetical protein
MDTWLLVLGGLGFAALAVQIWRGATFANISEGSHTRSVSRKVEPGKFWRSIAVQFIVLVGLILVFKFLVV